ncbi:MAG: oligosaccharide flippase family protein, partial [Phycisphaerales bacterium]
MNKVCEEKMNEQRVTTAGRLAYNTVFNVAALASHAVIGFFMIRFLLGRLGEDRYGVWVLIGGTLFRYAPMLSIGLSSSINRYIPVYLAKDDPDGVQRVISTSLFFFAILACVVAVVSLVVYCNVESWFVIEPELVRTAGILVLIVGSSLVIAMPLQPSTAVLSGMQRYDLINLVQLASLFSRTALLVVLLSKGYGLVTVGLIYGLSEITIKILHSAFAARLLPAVSLLPAKIDWSLLKDMLVYGANTFLYAVGAVIVYQASTLIIGAFLGTAQISQFFVATIAVSLLSQLVSAFTAAVKPAVSDLDARDDTEKVKEIAFLTQKYSLLLIIPGGFFLVAMPSEFLTICFGDRFENPAAIDAMAVVLAVITVGHCARLAQHSNFLVLVGRGQHRIFGVLTAVMAILCVSASVVSVTVFDFGLLGIAWSNFLPMVLISSVILPVYFNRKMRISTLECISRVWWPAVLGSLPAVFMIGIWKYLNAPDSWP